MLVTVAGAWVCVSPTTRCGGERRFSSEESVAFINGVLDAVRKDVPAAET